MKWNEWVGLAILVLILGLNIYYLFFQEKAGGTITYIQNDSLTTHWRDCTIVIQQREKVIEKHYEYEHNAVTALPDSLLLGYADSLATILRQRKHEVTQH